MTELRNDTREEITLKPGESIGVKRYFVWLDDRGEEALITIDKVAGDTPESAGDTWTPRPTPTVEEDPADPMPPGYGRGGYGDVAASDGGLGELEEETDDEEEAGDMDEQVLCQECRERPADRPVTIDGDRRYVCSRCASEVG